MQLLEAFLGRSMCALSLLFNHITGLFYGSKVIISTSSFEPDKQLLVWPDYYFSCPKELVDNPHLPKEGMVQ